MTVTTHWFVITAALAALLCTITIWSHRSVKVKAAALLSASLFLPLGYISLNDVLSRPKPVQLETVHRQLNEAMVVGSLMKENIGIYLWLQLPDLDDPRSYKLPWSEATAKKLHKANQDAEEKGTNVTMKKPFEKSQDNLEPVFYATPQQALPQKKLPDEQPILFNAAHNN